MNSVNPFRDIDFLPAEYRQSRSRLKSQPRRLIVTVLLAALVSAGTGVQYYRRHQVDAELAAVAPQYEAAVRQSETLGRLQTRLSAAQADAELFTYLLPPWPRTQILDALLAPLPEDLMLDQLQIAPEAASENVHLASGAEKSKAPKLTEEELGKLPPAVRDLRQLRQQDQRQQTVVTLSGVTSDTEALHRYIGELAKVPLFSKAELTAIETDSNARSQRPRFSARLVVRPGYGQPGGPVGGTAKGTGVKP